MTVAKARDLGLRVAGGSGQEEHVYCPFHDDKTASASYNHVKGVFYCQTCKVGYNITQLVKKLELGKDFLDDIAFAAPFAPENFDLELFAPEAEIPEGTEIPPFAMQYLCLERQLTRSQAVHYFKMTDKRQGVTIYPTDFHGNVVCSITRILGAKRPKPRYMVRGEKPPLWPLNELLSDYGTLIIVEGIFSRLRLERILEEMIRDGEPAASQIGTMSLLGSTLKTEVKYYLDQVQTDRLVFLFDDDFGGEKGAVIAAKTFPHAEVYKVKQEIDTLPSTGLMKLIRRLAPKHDS